MSETKKFIVTYLTTNIVETQAVVEVNNDNYALEDYWRLQDDLYDYAVDVLGLESEEDIEIDSVIDATKGELVRPSNYGE